jgi:uncharacterized protein YneF (UPF0154 family)
MKLFNKKGGLAPETVVVFVLCLLVLVVIGFIINQQLKKTNVTLNPINQKIDFDTCRYLTNQNQKEGRPVYDFDGDGLQDSCDPCINGPIDLDLNGNHFSDYCEHKSSTSSKIVPLGKLYRVNAQGDELEDTKRFCNPSGIEGRLDGDYEWSIEKLNNQNHYKNNGIQFKCKLIKDSYKPEDALIQKNIND